jgi:hypothetical protein
MFNALKNLFSRQSAPTLLSLKDAGKGFDHDYESPYPNAAPPIIVSGEVDDNSLQVLGLITDAADLLSIDLFNSNLYQYYQSAVHGELLPEDLDEDELVLMKEWTSATVLPERFCVDLLEFFNRTDGVKEKIEQLSQYRFERLRTWSNCHVH